MFWQKLKSFFNKKNVIIVFFAVFVVITIVFSYQALLKMDKKVIAIKSLALLGKVSRFLPMEKDTKKELGVINNLAEEFTKKDGVEKNFLILLQNNLELRPGGGFLGQYAIVKIKDGEVVSTFVEDANLLDQRITAKVSPPYPFTRMMQIKKWKFRDSNFSPDFPTNVEKAKYFFRLSGKNSDFDGVIAINSDVFNHVLRLTGPITVPGYPGEYNSENANLKLEEQVEKGFENQGIDVQNRKLILKKMAPIIIDKLLKINNISKIAEFVHSELKNKDVMLNFKNPRLQTMIESVFWDGRVSTDWTEDYLMAVDANMGALKTDYYIRREASYDIDLTGEKPIVTLNILYKNTATYGDWRTSDYHSYLRLYVPKGANLLERKMVSYPNIGEEFGKTYFGFILHVLIGGQTDVMVKYELPAEYKNKDYKLLVQKQSGVGTVPVKIHVKSDKGEFTQESTLESELKFELQ